MFDGGWEGFTLTFTHGRGIRNAVSFGHPSLNTLVGTETREQEVPFSVLGRVAVVLGFLGFPWKRLSSVSPSLRKAMGGGGKAHSFQCFTAGDTESDRQ